MAKSRSRAAAAAASDEETGTELGENTEACSSCGTEYPASHRKGWGRDTGIGYGQRPVCTELVDQAGDVIPPELRAVVPGHVCRGELRPL